jgi:molybdopterin-binding protein
VASGPFEQAARDPAFAALLDVRDVGTAVSGLLMHTSHDQAQRYHWLRADHVVLAGEQPKSVSTRNVLEGDIVSIRREEDESRLVELKTSVGTILARVTMEAVAELGLAEGRRAWALVKAHAL